MASLTDAEIDAALARGEELALREPRARNVRFESSTRRIIVELTNGCSFIFPVHLVPDLESADDDELASIEVLGLGHGLLWPSIDVALSVQNLLAGLFGTRSHQARRAGATRSKAKADAARKNGLKGGRPRRIPA
jgi:hypothetical protein